MAISTALLGLQQKAFENLYLSAAILVLFVPLIYIIVNEFIRASARIKKLHGPPGLPLIGNLWDIRVNAAEQYRSWARKYGSVYQIQLGNIPIVVVNTAASAKTIFGQNAQALSSRPEFYTFHKVCLESFSLSELPYTDYQT